MQSFPTIAMHVAIIMGGADRCPTPCGPPRSLGGGEAAAAVHAAVSAAARSSVATLTLYADAAARRDRLRRISGSHPATALLLRYLLSDTRYCVEHSIRIHVIGPRGRMDESVRRAVAQSERASAAGSGMRLRVVADYSAHDRLVRAAWNGDPRARIAPGDFHRRLDEIDSSAIPAGAVDLLIRTEGEERLGEFMLWEAAYAQLHSAQCLWPEFSARHFDRALRAYAARQRRVDELMAAAS